MELAKFFVSERIKNYQIILSHCLIDLLIDHEYEEIDSRLILANTPRQFSENNIWMANDKIDLLRVYFQFSNNTIITEAFDDFKEDMRATVNEKLTDIIIRKCEFHQKKKVSLKKLYNLRFSDFEILFLFTSIIADLSKKALIIAGDESKNVKNKLIIMGLASSYSLIFNKWVYSPNEDISYIMKLADKYLNNAEELARNIGLL